MADKASLPEFDPPLLNSANPWATTEKDISALYNCVHTGAITVRTSLINGFQHDDSIHQHCFFDGAAGTSGTGNVNSSLNTIGYSPLTLQEYIQIVHRVVTSSKIRQKPVIFSVTGTAFEVGECLALLAQSPCKAYCGMEINLSCPNIPGKPPPAYSAEELKSYLAALPKEHLLPVGLKLPPYTYHDQFAAVIAAVSSQESYPIAFLTSTNTLGSSLILNPETLQPALNSASEAGIGGLAGAVLHPLALGNVKTLRTMLDAADLGHVRIIGVGGVSDHAGFLRMKKVGAWAVAVGTALGIEGVDIFERILSEK